MSKASGQIPRETIDRLFSYMRPLLCMVADGTATVSSRELAETCGVNPAVLRKDLSYLGKLGKRGVGYPVGELIAAIRGELRLDCAVAVALVGVGNIGRALLEQPRLEFEGFRIVAAFDNDPKKIGTTVGQTVVEDVEDLEARISSEGLELAILTVHEAAATDMARRLGNAGITSIVSFAPCRLVMPGDVKMTCLDLSLVMARLVYSSRLGGSNPTLHRNGESG